RKRRVGSVAEKCPVKVEARHPRLPTLVLHFQRSSSSSSIEQLHSRLLRKSFADFGPGADYLMCNLETLRAQDACNYEEEPCLSQMAMHPANSTRLLLGRRPIIACASCTGCMDPARAGCSSMPGFAAECTPLTSVAASAW